MIMQSVHKTNTVAAVTVAVAAAAAAAVAVAAPAPHLDYGVSLLIRQLLLIDCNCAVILYSHFNSQLSISSVGVLDFYELYAA